MMTKPRTSAASYTSLDFIVNDSLVRLAYEKKMTKKFPAQYKEIISFLSNVLHYFTCLALVLSYPELALKLEIRLSCACLFCVGRCCLNVPCTDFVGWQEPALVLSYPQLSMKLVIRLCVHALFCVGTSYLNVESEVSGGWPAPAMVLWYPHLALKLDIRFRVHA